MKPTSKREVIGLNIVKKPSVLVCVTGQYNCDRLIKAGYELAAGSGLALHVFCVHSPANDLTTFSEELEYLYRTAKDLGADMTVSFSHNAPGSTADFAHKVNAKHLITGVPDYRPNGFVLTLHKLLPRIQITTVTNDGERMLYSLDATSRSFA